MKNTIIILFVLASCQLFAQETIAVLPNDKVEVTIVPETVQVKKDTVDLEALYDGDLKDIEGIETYIAKLQADLEAAQAQLAERRVRIAVIEKRAKEIKKEKEPKEEPIEGGDGGKKAGGQ